MEVYKTLIAFKDAQNDKFVQRVDSLYVTDDKSRAKELASTKNTIGEVLIKKLTKQELIDLAEQRQIEIDPSAKVDELHETVGSVLSE